MNDFPIRSLSPQESRVVLSLAEEDTREASRKGIIGILGVSPEAADHVIRSLRKKGWLERASWGRYLLIPPDQGAEALGENNVLALASQVADPYYIGYGTAAAHYGLTTQHRNVIWLATPLHLRDRHLLNSEVRIVNPTKRKFFGFTPVNVLGYEVLMSDREKTAIDCIDRPELCGGVSEAAYIFGRACRKLDWDKAHDYIKRIGSITLVRKFGWLTDHVGAAMPDKMKLSLLAMAGPKTTKATLGSKNRKKGILGHQKDWNITVNVSEAKLRESKGISKRHTIQAIEMPGQGDEPKYGEPGGPELIKCGDDFRTIWLKDGSPDVVQVIDQRRLPHEYRIQDLRSWQDGVEAISDMCVRGAPLIGATAAWSLYLAALANSKPVDEVRVAADALRQSRPTAVNLHWAIERVLGLVETATRGTDIASLIRTDAQAICDEDIEICRHIGTHGLTLLAGISEHKGGDTVNVLTHCNAGALATINWGTATAPVYSAHRQGLDVHVWVDETRPRNQGSQLTTWELAQHGVPHTLIVDNAGGHLMQHGEIDIVITGTDRTTCTGDVANKIGTYLKALAAHDNDVPFYVALPSTTIDWTVRDGVAGIPIEQRGPDEVSHVYGMHDGEACAVNTTANDTPISNYAFDVTPARLVTGLITERGICEASETGLKKLFPEMAAT